MKVVPPLEAQQNEPYQSRLVPTSVFFQPRFYETVQLLLSNNFVLLG